MKQFTKIIGAVVMVLLLMAGAYYLYDTFHQRSSSEKIAEIIHLEDSRLETTALKSYLADEDPVVRSRAALAVGRIGAPGSGKLLFDLVTSDVIDVAATAAFALGLTDEKEYASDLLEFALDAPVRVAVAAVEAAGRLSDSSRTDEILMLAGFLDHVAPEVRQAACLALFRAGAKDHGPRLILLLAVEPDEEVQIAALYALVRLKVKEAFTVYEEYLADADPYVRSLAVRGFGLSDSPSAIRYLTIALNDCDRNVVAQAIGELARVKDADAQSKLAKKLQKATDEKLIVALMDALRAQKTEAALETIQEIIGRDAPVNVVCAGVKYLAAVQNDRAVMFVDSVSRLDNPQLKAACAEAYGIIGTRNVIAPLSFLFNDRSSLVRAAAFEELVKIDSDTSQFYLNTALADSDFVLPTLAIGNIQAEQRLSYLPALGRMMEKGSIGIDIRRALIDCAGAFLDSNKTDSVARQILVRGILDPSYVVRRQAADVYKAQFGEDKTNAVRAAETKISVRQLRNALDKYRVNPRALVKTNRGDFEMELLFDIAPLTVLNFISLSDKGFYDGLLFHRVIPNFVAQGGDPRGDGWGGPDYFIRCEYSEEPYRRGTVGMATSGKDTGGSQFFVALSPQPHLDGRYTVFGRVTSGMEIVDNIVMGDTIRTISVKEGKR